MSLRTLQPDTNAYSPADPRQRILFQQNVVPILRNLAEILADSHSMSVAVHLQDERLFAFGESNTSGTCLSSKGDAIPPCLSSQELRQARLNVLEQAQMNTTRVVKLVCAAKSQTLIGITNIPMLGLFTVIFCSRRPFGRRDPRTRLHKTLLGTIDLLARAMVHWHFLSERLVHELTLILNGANDLAERIGYLASHRGETEEGKNLRDLATDLRQDIEMGGYELENMLRYLSSMSHPTRKDADTYSSAFTRKYSSQEVDLSSELDRAISALRNRASDKGIQINNEAVFIEQPIISVDRFQLRRLLYNLLSNAIKYSYHSTFRGDRIYTQRFVKIFARDPDDVQGERVALVFENYGIGLLPGEERFISIPGYRGVLAQRDSKVGSGIGLSEVASILARFEGKMRFESVSLSDDFDSPHLVSVKIVLPLARKRGLA